MTSRLYQSLRNSALQLSKALGRSTTSLRFRSSCCQPAQHRTLPSTSPVSKLSRSSSATNQLQVMLALMLLESKRRPLSWAMSPRQAMRWLMALALKPVFSSWAKRSLRERPQLIVTIRTTTPNRSHRSGAGESESAPAFGSAESPRRDWKSAAQAWQDLRQRVCGERALEESSSVGAWLALVPLLPPPEHQLTLQSLEKARSVLMQTSSIGAGSRLLRFPEVPQ